MKHYLTALVLVGGLAAAQANAGCDYPAKPGKFPNGSEATLQEMQAAQKVAKQYQVDMMAYVDCLDTELKDKLATLPNATEKEKAELQEKVNQKHDAALEELKTVADDFNVQRAAYLVLHPPKPKTE